MRLRTLESFWLIKNGLMHSYPSLQNPHIETEIVVIGGGITGALISDVLIENGHQVVLVDKRDIGMGSTSATTSMLQYEIDVPLMELTKKIGEKGAVACYQAGRKAIHDLESLIKKKDIDCGFKNKKSLYLAHNRRTEKWLQKECAMRGFHNMGMKWLDEKMLQKEYGISASGAILSDTAASMDAYRCAQELIYENAQKGLQVFDQTEIKTITYGKEKTVLKDALGNTISCKKVIFCTGFESLEFIKENVANLITTYACVSERGISCTEKMKDVLVWDTADPYIYMRTTDDGRLLIGGEDVKYKLSAHSERLKEQKSKKLIKKAQQYFPKLHFVEDFNWAGTFGSTKDGLPYIAAHPKHSNAFMVMGFGGNGITFSIQARELVLDWLAGKENELAYYYRFGR